MSLVLPIKVVVWKNKITEQEDELVGENGSPKSRTNVFPGLLPEPQLQIQPLPWSQLCCSPVPDHMYPVVSFPLASFFPPATDLFHTFLFFFFHTFSFLRHTSRGILHGADLNSLYRWIHHDSHGYPEQYSEFAFLRDLLTLDPCSQVHKPCI